MHSNSEPRFAFRDFDFFRAGYRRRSFVLAISQTADHITA